LRGNLDSQLLRAGLQEWNPIDRFGLVGVSSICLIVANTI
jgi:hypothetical protein